MDNLDRLIEIASDINLISEAAQLRIIKQRSESSSAELILPLVGEFSAGKTTLINALTDSKQLETATKPTTATIFEIHFGSSKCYAEVFDANGEKREVEDISSLKNAELKDSMVVNVFDTATRISPNIILVDTPGLSSPDENHKQTLIDFLPQADGILLVVDVNQQITRSLTDFIKTMELAKRPVFLVITKSDTKADSELVSVKEYIAQNCNLPLSQVACVSAAKNNLDELYRVLDAIQADKGKILEAVNKQRISQIINAMVVHIDEMLQASVSDKEIEGAIREKERELRKIQQNIHKVVESAEVDIEDKKRDAVRSFEDNIFPRLDSIVAAQSANYNAEAVSAINTVSSIVLNDFKTSVSSLITRKIEDMKSRDESLASLQTETLDLSAVSVEGLSFNLDLNTIGHEYDGKIATGVKIAAAVGVVAAVVSTAGAAAGAAGAAGTAGATGTVATGAAVTTEAGVTAAELALNAGEVISVADTVSDVASIVSNERQISRIQKAMSFAGQVGEQYNSLNEQNAAIGQQMGAKKGLVESMVGFVTDKTWGKPQRRRAIRLYIDDTLLPEFKQLMGRNCTMILQGISKTLQENSEVVLAEKMLALVQLKKEREEKKDAFEQRLETLRDYKNELLTI
ncbi:MAG: dynamin family protein [Bacteroidaceae bacterium]|nr:dynamin family protein [Bacteroidaceae bacterium]